MPTTVIYPNTLERTGDWKGISGGLVGDSALVVSRAADQWTPEFTAQWIASASTNIALFTPSVGETGYIHVIIDYFNSSDYYRHQVYTYNKTSSSSITFTKVDDFGDSAKGATMVNDNGVVKIAYDGASLTAGQAVTLAIRSERGYSI